MTSGPRLRPSSFLVTYAPKTAGPSPASSLCPRSEEGTAKKGKGQGLAGSTFLERAFPEVLSGICLNLIGQNCHVATPRCRAVLFSLVGYMDALNKRRLHV